MLRPRIARFMRNALRTPSALTSTPIPTMREAGGYFVRLVQLARPHWAGLSRSLGMGLILAMLGLVSPYLGKLYFDDVYPGRDANLMHVLVIAVAVFSIATALMGALRGYYSQVVAAVLAGEINLMYLNHLQHLPLRFYEKHRVGEVLSRLGDVRVALESVSSVFQTVLVNGAYLVVVPPFLLFLNWKLTLVALAMTPVRIATTMLSSRIIRRYMKLSAEHGAELGATQVEALTQIRAVKALGAEHTIFGGAQHHSAAQIRAQLKGAAIGAGFGVVNGVIGALGAAAFAWYAWTLILQNSLTLGTFVAFSAYLGYITGPIGAFTGLFADFQRTAVTLGRAFEYLDLPTEQPAAAAFTAAPVVRSELGGSVQLDRVSLSYRIGSKSVDDVSLTLHPGTVTAIVGPSGAGKSSLLRLLGCMDRPDSGTVMFDGRASTTLALSDIRQQVGLVWQEPCLFRGTLWENLTFGLSSVDELDVREAVRLCMLDDLFTQLPNGFQSLIAEWGVSVSGGQRQRLAIARALIGDPKVLLLDEATSQVDAPTEERLLRGLFDRMRERTVAFVTHRVATAVFADQICVMENGRLVAVGSHARLLSECGVYAEMLRATQSGGSNV
jgi:ABC-type bacteriocin/lantibiotic exporter with double-glycine peptidase domain